MAKSGRMPHKKRILFIGFDAGDTDLIEQWCQEGLLPNISQMRKQGTWGRLRTTAEIVHVSAWPSIFTGTPPDQHGLYHAYVMRPGQQNPLRPRPDLSPVPFLWKLLNDHGKRCVIMDAFMTCPLQPFCGTQIVEWGTWSWFWEPTIRPASLKKELQKQFGVYPAEDHSKVGMAPPSDYPAFYQRLLAAVEKKTRVVQWLMEREDWDFFLVVFGESHPAGHYFWQFHDPSYFTHPQNAASTLRSALQDVYIALDRAVGTIRQCVDEHTTVFLASGDGMGPNYSGSHILTPLLSRMGLFSNTQNAQHPQNMVTNHTSHNTKRHSQLKADVLSTLRNMIPKNLRVAVSRTLLPRHINERLSLRWKTAGIVWEQTRAFLIENANEGYIRLNLQGREPFGIVAPGEEYEQLCKDIQQTAMTMVNPTNGKRAALTVYKTDDIFQGPCRSHMPDIIINWDEEARVTTDLLTDKYGLVRSEHPGCALTPYYTGNHRPTAFTVAVGPDIPANKILEGASILDLAPTILSHFGMTQPEYMHGKMLHALGSYGARK